MWHVALIVNEMENRTTSDDIANFLNQCEEDGLNLVAATGGFLFFRQSDTAPQTDFMEEDYEVMYEEDEEEEEPVHEVPTKPRRRRKAVANNPPRPPQRRRRARATTPDPSVRKGGSDIDPATGLPLGAVQVDPRLLQGQGPAMPSSAPRNTADPFGLG